LFAARTVLFLTEQNKIKVLIVQVEAVLFDLFDTLVLIEGGETFYEPALKKIHKSLTQNKINIRYDVFRHTYFEVRDKLYDQAARTLEEPHFNIRVAQTLEKLGHINVRDEVVNDATMSFANEFERYVHLDSDTIPMLNKLKGAYKLGIVSNFAIPEWVLTLLKKLGLSDFFDTIVISGAVNKRKPSQEIFQKALKAISVDASRTVFVGDTPSMDVKGAKNAGLRVVLIKRKTVVSDSPKASVWKPDDVNDRFEPDYTIESLSELAGLLEKC
jgi:HAD superfamily hydrolase (TIGR01662 family)